MGREGGRGRVWEPDYMFTCKTIGCRMSKKVKCIFPNGSARVMLIGATPTVNTFRLIARNHVRTECSHMKLRYGVPPSYTTRALSDRQAEVVLEDIGNRETVWIDMCPECKGSVQYLCKDHGGNNQCMNTCGLQTVDSLKSTTQQSHRYVCDETLSPNGYYYELVSHELGLENFKVYSFGCFPSRFFIYLSNVNRLIEMPPKLISIRREETVPEEFLLPAGFLYWIIAAHTTLTHMSFYSFPMLPGRLFVFDAGLDRLIETAASSPLVESLLGDLREKVDGAGCAYSWPNNNKGNAVKSESCDSEKNVSYCSSSFSFQFETVHTNSTSKGGHTSYGSSTVYYRPSVSTTDGQFQSPNQPIHNKLTIADLTVYEPSSLDVSLPKPALLPQCSVPPCVYYNGMDSDPR